MKLSKRLFILILVSISCVGCDQGTKELAAQYLSKGGMDSFFFDIFRIGYTENTGGFLGLGSSLPPEYRYWIFTVATGLVLLFLFTYLVANSRHTLIAFIGGSLFFAGGISNFYDRATNDGAVIDFLNVGVGMIRTGIFNIADIALMIGVALIILSESNFWTGRTDV